MVVRETKETRVVVELRRGGGQLSVSTPVPFLTHMVETLLYYADLEGRVEAIVLRELDEGHHVIEDVGLALGMALAELAGDRRSIARYGWAIVPMDEAEAIVAVDMGGRPFWSVKARFPPVVLGGYPLYMFPHFVRSLASESKSTIHVRASGEDPHHIIEAAHKALGLALKQALTPSNKPVTTK